MNTILADMKRVEAARQYRNHAYAIKIRNWQIANNKRTRQHNRVNPPLRGRRILSDY